jgi:hypothetical protein
MRTLFSILIIGSVCGAALAQPLSGPRQYPQFRNMSGLPGGLFGVTSSARPSMSGAMAISSPIGYSLGDYHVAAGFANMSKDRRLRFPKSRSDNADANGTAQGMVGIPTSFGNVTLVGMIHSGIGDSVLNVQFSPKLEKLGLDVKGLGVSFGVQDAFSTGGAAGNRQPGDGDISRSYFVAATYEVSPGVHVTVGKGDRRFQGLFGSASFNAGKRVKFVIENDTFNTNYAIAYNVGPLRKADPAFLLSAEDDPRRGDVFFSIGIIRESRIFWGFNITY